MCEFILPPVGGALRVPAPTACLLGKRLLRMLTLSTVTPDPQQLCPAKTGVMQFANLKARMPTWLKLFVTVLKTLRQLAGVHYLNTLSSSPWSTIK